MFIQARHNGQNYVFALLTGYRDPPAGITVIFLLYLENAHRNISLAFAFSIGYQISIALCLSCFEPLDNFVQFSHFVLTNWSKNGQTEWLTILFLLLVFLFAFLSLLEMLKLRYV